MPIEHSAGVVIFRKEGGKALFLLLQYPQGARSKKEYWDFVKGHIEKGENELDTVKREVREETGLKDIRIVKGFKETIKYFFSVEGKNIFKTVVFYLAETKNKEIKISSEHVDFKWLIYDRALRQLAFKNAKNILKKAKEVLLSQ